MHIRTIEQKDNKLVAEIIRTVMTEYGAVGEGFSIMDPEVDFMYEAYTKPNAAYFVLEDKQGMVVGCAGLGPLPAAEPDICELKKMYYLPKARGKGYGRKMIAICEAKATELGYKRMYLETLGSMREANQLYRASGFVPLSCAIGHTGHGSCDAYYMKQIG